MSEFTTEMTGVMIDPVTGEIVDQKELAERLLAQAKEQGVSLVGPGGLLNQLGRFWASGPATAARVPGSGCRCSPS
ncbi:hypothetical protein JOE31_002816 [Arthrobacter sp. PvP023]|uniref:hypothetical protein n=1 Tax=Micrococcaceae TaxID=1268 RepID=UPI001B5D2DB5|nr:hypothetical protein [Arthrobacter sp. PvP023]MBP1136584.1 hypothetical protein [Arthrobacter sp. PvP023]